MKKEEYLDEKLLAYSKSHIYPFHMPGHKRQSLEFPNPYEIDITEIDGFDNLHHAEGILAEIQERGARLYGSLECHQLINGSSCGILASILATCSKGDHILVARNCHKAVYHGILLQELLADYVYPMETGIGIQGQISAISIKEKLEEAKKNGNPYRAVIITSPTYDGVVSDIEEIAKVAHSFDCVLIVDQAHGAHFGFDGNFPESAVKQGADLVIMSLHKTLPCFTQTALLHRCSDRVEENQIRKYLGIFETSSPSYIFMAGIDKCLRYVAEEGDLAFATYGKKLEDFHAKVSDLTYLKVVGKDDFSKDEAYDFDFGKLVILSRAKGYRGVDLYRELLESYGLQMEMKAGNYVLAMTSIMDTDQGMERLNKALHEIDQKLAETTGLEEEEKPYHPYREMETFMTIAEADVRKGKAVPFEEAIGKISKAYIYLYPPGIPLIVPGEEITGETIEALSWCQEKGMEIEGIPQKSWITIVI